MKAAAPRWQYGFEGRIVVRDYDRYRYTVVYLPDEIANELPFEESSRLRFHGVIGAFPIAAAWQPAVGRRWYCILSKRTLRASGYRLGELALVRFNLEPQDKVRVPEALQAFLDGNPKMLAAWNRHTPGFQRGLAFHVGSAKREETIAKRIEQVSQWLLDPESIPRAKPRKTATRAPRN